MKKVLMLASVASMIDQFNVPNIDLLQKMGYDVDVACNFMEGNTCSEARITNLKMQLSDKNVRCYQIDFARNIKRIEQNMRAYHQVKELMRQECYAFCHCHNPIGGVVARIAGHRTKTKMIYTAYGLSEHIRFLGFRNGLHEILQISDCFVLSSFREGLSVALMEAMAEGLPVVCGRICGNVDLVEDGKGGILLESGCVQ